MIRSLALLGAGAAVGAFAALRYDGRIQYMRMPVAQQTGPMGVPPSAFDDLMDDLEPDEDENGWE